MRDESSEFTAGDLMVFLDEMVSHDRDNLVARLEGVAERLRKLAGVDSGGIDSGPDWSPREVLAHMAVISKFYGSLTYRVGSGQVAEMDLLTVVHMRDKAAQQLLAAEPDNLLQLAIADQLRTAAYLRTADPAALRRTCLVDGGLTMTAEEIARLLLVSHLEQHVQQLEAELAGGSLR